MKLLAVLTTIDDREAARRMAREIVERRLAACAQVSEVESFYRWDGVLCDEREFRVLFKTTVDGYEAVERAIRELHSYELPAIVAVPVERVYAPYGEWVAAGSAGR